MSKRTGGMYLGRITSVRRENGMALINAQTNRRGVEKRDVPVMKPFVGGIFVPREGDTVVMSELDDGRPVALGVLNKPEYDTTACMNGEMVFQFSEDAKLCVSESDTGGLRIHLDAPEIELGTGGAGAVTDLVTTSADGYVTSVEIVRSDSVSIE